MNATILNDIRQAFPARDLADEKMNQVRELLIGDFARASEARIAALEGRIRDLETGIGERLSALDHRIGVLAADHTADRQAAFDELGKSVRDLGERIRQLPR